MHTSRVAVFAYGSLLLEPELPQALVRATPVALDGVRRALCIRSRARGCTIQESGWPEVPVPGPFRRGSQCYSLVFGTLPAQDWLHGVLLEYDADPDVLMPRLQRRVGHARVATNVTVRRGRNRFAATAWLSDRSHSAVIERMALSVGTRILLHATPNRPGRGLHYVTGVRAALGRHHITDPGIERVISEVRNTLGGVPRPAVIA
jgi:cation transport regulator ChaC